MWIEQALTTSAPQQGPGCQRVRIVEDVVLGVLFPAVALASRAFELAVEGIESFDLRLELVLISFQQFFRYLGIHLNDAHVRSVERWVQENK
jgi:hypothetical protein